MTVKGIVIFSGSGVDAKWDSLIEGAKEEGWTVDKTTHSATRTETVTISDLTGMMEAVQISQNGKKIRLPTYEESPEIILIKQ